MSTSRRNFLRGTAVAAVAVAIAPILPASKPKLDKAFAGYNQIIEDITDVQPMETTITMFPGDQYEVGDYILISGTEPQNNGRYQITEVSTTTLELTVEPAHEQTKIPKRHNPRSSGVHKCDGFSRNAQVHHQQHHRQPHRSKRSRRSDPIRRHHHRVS